MKRALSLILVMVMVLSMVPAVYAETAEPIIIASGTDVAVTATEAITHTWTAESNGVLTVTMGATTPGYRYTITDSAGETVGLPKATKLETTITYNLVGGETYTFTATGWNNSTYDVAASTLTYTLSFVAAADDGGEVEKVEYDVSDTALVLGDNTLTLLETAVTTIYVYEPSETGVYTFTAPEGAILGYWGAGSWFLTNPNSTTNTYEWTCTGVGQSAYIGVSGVDGSFNLNVAKTGDYTVVETPIVVYENKATLETFTLPEGSKLGSYIDVTAETKHTAVLGDDGYYHFNSADGDVILVDMNYQDIILSNALLSDRPVMYAYTTDENGNDVKYDIGAAIKEYEAVMDANGYYPLTEDLILFYDTYAVGAGTYTFYVTTSYNEENVWMYCMRTVTMPEVTEPEETEPEETEPEETEPEESEPEVTEPEVSEPEVSEPEVSTPEVSEPVDGVIVLEESVTGSSSTKYVYSYTPEEDGTLSITVGDGSANWNSDVVYFAGVSMTTVGSASGTNADTYEVDVTAGTAYRIRVWTSGGTATPLKVVFQSNAEIPTEPTDPTEPETPKNAYENSGLSLTVGDNTLTLLDTAVTTIYKFKPTETGTYIFTGPEGSVVGNWGSNAYYLVDPNGTSNTCEWTCTGVGQSVFIGVSNVEGSFNLNVVLKEMEPEVTEPEVTEPEVTEPEVTEPEVTEPEVTEPVTPSPDVPGNVVFAVISGDNTAYYEYGSQLIEAVNSVSGTATVILYKNIDLGTSFVTVADGQNITLDLNGCTLSTKKSSGGVISVSGTLTVQDTSAAGDGLISNTATSSDRGIVVTGTLTVKSGNITATTQGIRVESGSLSFEGGSVTATNYGIYVGGTATTATISGGYINSGFDTFNNTVSASGSTTVYITGGYFNGSAASGGGLTGRVSGGCFARKFTNAAYLADGCYWEDRLDTVYLFEVINPNAEPEEPDVTEPEETEPEDTEPEVTEPDATEPEVSEPEVTEPSTPDTSEPEVTEPSDSNVITSGTNVEATVAVPVTYTWTAAANGKLTVTMGAASPGWRYTITDAAGNTVGLPKTGSTEKSAEFELVAGTQYTFTATGFNSSTWEEVSANITYTLTFEADEGEGEVVVSEYEVSETPLVLGDNSLTLLETATTTIYVFEPTETGVYTFTAPEGAILGYWGAGSWFLTNPNSTTNTYEWTCTGVGQSAYIGVSGVTGSFNLNVEKTGDYTVVEIPIVQYENKAPLSSFTLPEGTVLGSYIDVTAETVYTAVLGADGYYHLNSADGPIILVDMNYMDIVLSNALLSDRPVMYAYVTDDEGNQIKYDIGAAIKEYEAVMDENGYYPLTEDLILFYDTYAVGAGVYTFYVTGDYNEENVWMYCMRTATFPVNPVDRWNLVLDDDLNVNFYVNMGENDSVQVTVAGSPVTYKASDLEMSADGKYIVSVSIAAAQMMDEITVQIVGSDVVKSYTVRQYADTVLADTTLTQYHALIKEMLNYGAAAQTYFDHNSGNLANADITDVAAEDVPETAEELVVDDKLDNVTFYGASLVYRDKIAIRFYFTGDVTGCVFTDANGKTYEPTEKDGKYYIEVANILPQDLDQQIKLTVMDADGNTLTVTYGAMNYMVRMNAKGDESLQNLMKALYNYHLAANVLRAN